MNNNIAQAVKKLKEDELGDSSLILKPMQAKRAFTPPRPDVIKAVREKEFQDFDDLIDWVEDSFDTEESPHEIVGDLFTYAIVDHPRKHTEEGLDRQEDKPLEVIPDYILSIPYAEEADHIENLKEE